MTDAAEHRAAKQLDSLYAMGAQINGKRDLERARETLRRLEGYLGPGDSYNHDRAIDALGYVRLALEELKQIHD